MTTEPVPAKHHQPLHNFSLPFLKWGQRLQINHHCRRRHRSSPLTDSDDSELNHSTKPHRSRNRTPNHTKNKIDEENGDVLLERNNNCEKLIKLTDVEVVTAADGDVKPWNLRPRRFSINTDDGNGAVAGVSSAKSVRLLRGGGGGAAAAEENEEDRKKKRRLWISLSKEEIEEDVHAFTGSKPARRPKKRNKTVQKQVDNVFPGLYLVGVSASSYRV